MARKQPGETIPERLVSELQQARDTQGVNFVLRSADKIGVPHTVLHGLLGNSDLLGRTFDPDAGRFLVNKNKRPKTSGATLATKALSLNISPIIDSRLAEYRWGGALDGIDQKQPQKLRTGPTAQRLGHFLATLPYVQAQIAEQPVSSWDQWQQRPSHDSLAKVSHSFFRPATFAFKQESGSDEPYATPADPNETNSPLIEVTEPLLTVEYGNLPVLEGRGKTATTLAKGLSLQVFRHNYFTADPSLGKLSSGDIDVLSELAVPATVGDADARDALRPVASALVVSKEFL